MDNEEHHDFAWVQKLLVSEFLVDIVRHTVRVHYEQAREEIIEGLGREVSLQAKTSMEPILNPRVVGRHVDGVKWRPRKGSRSLEESMQRLADLKIVPLNDLEADDGWGRSQSPVIDPILLSPQSQDRLGDKVVGDKVVGRQGSGGQGSGGQG